jgi:hypothetical protein
VAPPVVNDSDRTADLLSWKDVGMITTVATADWIKRIADDERKRDAVRLKDDERAARKADLVHLHGRRLLDELHAVVTRDAEAFSEEFAGNTARTVVVDAAASDGGFTVRKPAPLAVSLAVTPNFEGATLTCHYSFTRADSLPPREDRIEVLFAADGSEGIQMKHQNTGQVFASAEALSELLLVPVLTGRPR